MQTKTIKRTAVLKVFSFLKPYRFGYIFGMALYGSQQFLFAYTMALMLSWLTAAIAGGSAERVVRAAILFLAIIVVYFTALGVGVYSFVVSEERAVGDLKRRVFRSFVRASIEKGADSHSGEGIAALNTDADTACQIYDNALAGVLNSVTAVVLSAAVIFGTDWRLGLVSVVVGLVAFFAQYRFAKPLGEINKELLTANAGTVRTFSDLFAGGACIRAYGLEGQTLARFDADNLKMLTLMLKSAAIALWQSTFKTLQGWLSLAGIFGVGGYLVATGQITLAALMLVPTLGGTLAGGIASIGSAWAGLQAPIEACVRIRPLLDAGEEAEPVSAAADDRWDGDATLCVEHLNFAYRESERNALDDISLTIPQNKTVAFVGLSGSGKSTLLRLLLGLYDRDDLPVTIGNCALTKAAAAQWRGRFAYVDQSCKLFDLTIAENIGLGLPGSTQADIERAAAAAGADGFIRALPEGYDTACGESGSFLSGGQKQRIAIARALVRKAPVLVFDEATSALDNESERYVMETIRNLRGSHTVLIATHNLKEIADADLIVVMDNGRIADTGTHDELRACCDIYRKLIGA